VSPAATTGRPDRLRNWGLAAWPVLCSSAIVSAIAIFQASEHPTPWLFSDEIEYARSPARSPRRASPRRGVEYWVQGSSWLIAPFWWIDDLGSAYAWVKTPTRS
jgi:hypothetical protein